MDFNNILTNKPIDVNTLGMLQIALETLSFDFYKDHKATDYGKEVFKCFFSVSYLFLIPPQLPNIRFKIAENAPNYFKACNFKE